MRNSTYTVLFFIVLSYSATAQKLTLLPQVGFENPVTKLNYNNLSAFRPLECQLSRTVGVRLDYKTKQGYGPFIGVTTTRSSVAYSFANAESGMSDYMVSTGKMQLQLQAGLQASSKRIYFKKSGTARQATVKPSIDNNVQRAYSRCGAYKAAGQCGFRNRNHFNRAPENKSWFVRVMPSAGLAINPFAATDISPKVQNAQTVSTYNAGNFKAAVFAGMGFELGSNNTRHFTVTLNYIKGLGNNAESITTEPGLKPVTTNLSSKVSGFNASIGIPFSLSKKARVKGGEKKRCEFMQYRSSCRRII